ncbi:MAG: DUF3365 domain-containing protein [Desulfococcaceae bacterium]
MTRSFGPPLPLESTETGKGPEASGRRWNLGLQLQFQLALGALFLLFSLVAAMLIYAHEKRQLEENALRKSHLVMAAVESTRAYVRDTLRPRMYAELGPEGFVLEAMSTSYITRAVMDRFKETLPEYRYRRVAVNARNPVSEPTSSELDLIRFFHEHPESDRWRGMRTVQGDVAFVHARPVRMGESCLACHGEVSDAPMAMVAQYGAERGFGYAENQLAGVMAVSIPVRLALEQIRGRALSVFWVTLLLLVFLYVLIIFLFNRMVIRSLRGLLAIFHQGLVGEEEERLLKTASQKVEIDELADAAQDLTRHLAAAREKVARHAEEMERCVTDRTRELEISQARLREKVETRNRELATLNRIAERITRSPRLAEILPDVLDQTLRLIPADGAAIYLLAGEGESRALTLACRRNAEKLSSAVSVPADNSPGDAPASLPTSLTEALRIAAGGTMSQFGCKRNRNCLNVPLICRERVLGVMIFVGMDAVDPPAEMNALLLSIGQQIGVAVESLQNVHALLQSKEILQSVFDGIPDVMVLLDRDLRVRMVNRAYLKRNGGTLETALGRVCGAMGGSCQCPLAGRELAMALETRRETREEIRTEAGEIFRVYHYPILDETEEIWGVLRYAKDVTLEKQVEQRIQQTEKLAALGQLGAGVAHEINNPMGIILCYADLIRRQLAEADPIDNDLKVIEKQARNCQRIVTDLLNFARGGVAERRAENVNTAVTEVAEMVRHQFRKRSTKLTLALNDSVPPVPMDMDRMKQVFLNLMMNAQQAIGDGGGAIRVETGWSCTDPRRADCPAGEEVVEITIADNGGGIPPEVVEKIFDPFFSTKKTGEGTGLGLSVSYGIVKDHGGEIEVESEPGKGSRFTVRLPVSPPEGGTP